MIFHDLRKSGNREGGLDCGNIFTYTRKRVYRIRGQAHSGQALIFVQSQCNYSAIYRQSYFLEGQGSHPRAPPQARPAVPAPIYTRREFREAAICNFPEMRNNGGLLPGRPGPAIPLPFTAQKNTRHPVKSDLAGGPQTTF